MFSYLMTKKTNAKGSKGRGSKTLDNLLPLFLSLVKISSEEKETNTLLRLLKLALMIGPRTDTQFTGGRAT